MEVDCGRKRGVSDEAEHALLERLLRTVDGDNTGRDARAHRRAAAAGTCRERKGDARRFHLKAARLPARKAQIGVAHTIDDKPGRLGATMHVKGAVGYIFVIEALAAHAHDGAAAYGSARRREAVEHRRLEVAQLAHALEVDTVRREQYWNGARARRHGAHERVVAVGRRARRHVRAAGAKAAARCCIRTGVEQPLSGELEERAACLGHGARREPCHFKAVEAKAQCRRSRGEVALLRQAGSFVAAV